MDVDIFSAGRICHVLSFWHACRRAGRDDASDRLRCHKFWREPKVHFESKPAYASLPGGGGIGKREKSAISASTHPSTKDQQQ